VTPKGGKPREGGRGAQPTAKNKFDSLFSNAEAAGAVETGADLPPTEGEEVAPSLDEQGNEMTYEEVAALEGDGIVYDEEGQAIAEMPEEARLEEVSLEAVQEIAVEEGVEATQPETTPENSSQPGDSHPEGHA